MNQDNEDNLLDPLSQEVLNRLRDLAGEIDRRRYPGQAWPARRRGNGVRRIVFSAPGIAAAVAAAVLLMAGLWSMLQNGALGTHRPTAATQVASAPADTDVPSEDPVEIDPSIAGDVSLEIPSISIPTFSDGAGFEWKVPSLSFPSPVERSTSDES